MFPYTLLDSFLEQKRKSERERKLELFAEIRVSCHYSLISYTALQLVKIRNIIEALEVIKKKKHH